MRLTSDNEAATLSDVAAKAGVSKVTVSAVLNGSRSNTRVSDATRQRILVAAAELRYRPNAIARSLRRRKTNIIGFYSGHGVVNAQNPFLTSVIGGLQTACDDHRKDLLLHGLFRGRSVDDIYDELLNGTIDGLVLIAFPDNPLVDRLAHAPLPAVMIADSVPTIPAVVVDDAGGSRMLAEHLAEKGHRRILYRMAPDARQSALRRYEAFRAAAASLGMTLVHVSHAPHPGRLTQEEKAILTGPSGVRPTAMACWMDGFVGHALPDIAALGLRVPEDLAIVGFNGNHATPNPDLPTTILAPWVQVAETAVSVLVARMEGKEVPAETVLPVTFAPGATT